MSPATRIIDMVIEHNPDGTTAVEHGQVRVTHDDTQGGDQFLIDTDSGMLELPIEDVAELHHALGVMLEQADPHRVNRYRLPTACDIALDDFAERRAQAAVKDHGREAVAAQVAAANSGTWQADAAELAVWQRALKIADGAA